MSRVPRIAVLLAAVVLPVCAALLIYDPGSNVVDVYVRTLRRKLGGDVIQTIRGMGYRLCGG